MEELTQCTVCFHSYDNQNKLPLMLLCGHTFCKECLDELYQLNSVISCPQDRSIDIRQLDKIPKNIAFLQLVQEISSHQKLKVTEILKNAKNDRDQVKTVLEDLKRLHIILDDQEDESLRLLQTEFNKVRQLIDKKEHDLKRNITETHNVLGKSLTDFRNILLSYEKECESKISYFNKVRDSQGEDAYINSNEILTSPPNYKIVQVLKEKILKLPIKVLISPLDIENTLNKSARILDETQARGSEYQAEFIRDVRVFEGDRFFPGSSLVKTWRVKNSGQNEWADGCWCVFRYGEFSGEAVLIESAGVEEEIDISVICTAPVRLGRFKSYWSLVDSQGIPFGPFILVDINVVQIGSNY